MDLIELHEKVKEDNLVAVKLDDEFEYHIKKYISLDEFAAFVNQVKDSEFNAITGEYTPGVGNIVFKLCLVKSYTDLDLPDDLGLAYQIINELQIVEKIEEVVCETAQYNDLLEVVQKAIDYERDSQIGINRLYRAIQDTIKALPWDKLNVLLDTYSDPKNMNKLASAIAKNVDPDALNSIFKVLK